MAQACLAASRNITLAQSPIPPAAPPPTLASSATSTKTYSPGQLLSLQTPHLPAPERLASLPFLRRDSHQWGTDESSSTLLSDAESDSHAHSGEPGEPKMAAADLPSKGIDIPLPAGAGDGRAIGDVLFDFTSSVPRRERVMVDFTDPFSSDRRGVGASLADRDGGADGDPYKWAHGAEDKERGRASSAFQSFPSSVGHASALGTIQAQALGERFGSLRLGCRTPSVPRSDSTSSDASSAGRSRAGSAIGEGRLNPFAAPFPLPGPAAPRLSPSPAIEWATGRSSSLSSSPAPSPISLASDESYDFAAGRPDEAPSLPMPRSLPSSLPRKPNVSLPPVFVKRESAALPQPMALPDIAPLGRDWEGERNLSGNEKRRRVSEVGDVMDRDFNGTSAGLGHSLGVLSVRGMGGNAEGAGDRPERLIKLGERLRQSVAAKN